MLAQAGLALLGEAGTPADVQSAWKVFASADAKPSVRVSDSLGETSLTILDQAWNAMANQLNIISGDGEFLLTVEGEGTFGKPWLHVRTDGRPTIRDLGPYPGEPGFIASSLDRSAMVAVSTEEYEFWVLVADNGE
ncbi:hypothetical protein [Glycomyces buryatensis]|uniref:Uncharacterized protein n=1 Tax=Glycomyces buryatensis TaxID=2570927 RepID=A0A4S8Q1W9_9ACTN|nr:hypothetical protein [Glycomyces buryatensis]THV36475.1 hypothetical protein FAB82_22095 [Glycomyces buryatensis]